MQMYIFGKTIVFVNLCFCFTNIYEVNLDCVNLFAKMCPEVSESGPLHVDLTVGVHPEPKSI